MSDVSRFDAADRAVLAALADVLIPRSAGHLSASDAGVAAIGLDRVLESRPDLAAGLATLLATARDRDAAGFVAELRARDPGGFAILAEVVPGAYFLNDEVRARVGWAGSTAKPIDPHPDWLDDGLLDRVLARGRIYRPTPHPR